MKRILLVFGTFLSTMTFAQDCSDLFISEYVEGFYNNKALEIYNPTNASIDLSQYVVIRYSNGATVATSEYAVQLTGTIAPYSTHVGVVDKQNPQGTGNEVPVWDSLAIRADAWYSPDYSVNKTWYWNGNDCVALAKGTVGDLGNAQLVDLFGKIGEDPGNAWTSDFPYTGAGDVVTENHSMIRKASILVGQTNPTVSYFDPLAEYDSIPAVVDIGGQEYGNWFTLGWHDCDCFTSSADEISSAAKVGVYPNPNNGAFTVSGAEKYSSVVVINALGQEVKSISNNSKSTLSFNLGKRNGVYFVKLTDSEDNTIVKKVIVK